MENNKQEQLKSFRQPNRLDLMSIAEKAITNAIWTVEEAGASENLTNAVIKLGEARDLVYEHYRINDQAVDELGLII